MIDNKWLKLEYGFYGDEYDQRCPKCKEGLALIHGYGHEIFFCPYCFDGWVLERTDD